MSTGNGWRRELHRIRDDHRIAMSRAAEALSRAQAPAIDRRGRVSAAVSEADSDIESIPGSVLQPAHLDRREPMQHVETDPDERPRSWLV
ncbi:hypothetical protein CH251_03070 [Rhodococcus sp. 06-462-5]|uniref:hypothetical protein n=1 Tax=unclassified Rhodococcus (in: high G+C Gram-positive bacteria) TaxID=192944 RepID=UPI000B9C528B|nr:MULTISPECIES: hypothetical protein [unclassified Rhodococcus (in: high G+C Gram-positive bacteria)]OZC78737.1 hypothetical protein CH251_03070 [Rhodococcus sp. 06-462-5]OZE61989.1 hypothetical protein CH270_20105 [Rhodococcus sp. 02-925g]